LLGLGAWLGLGLGFGFGRGLVLRCAALQRGRSSEISVLPFPESQPSPGAEKGLLTLATQSAPSRTPGVNSPASCIGRSDGCFVVSSAQTGTGQIAAGAGGSCFLFSRDDPPHLSGGDEGCCPWGPCCCSFPSPRLLGSDQDPLLGWRRSTPAPAV
jgi:hypothetical protein